MTTTLIYEPIVSISYDYFRPLKARGFLSSNDNAEDQRVSETREPAVNISGPEGNLTRSEEEIA